MKINLKLLTIIFVLALFSIGVVAASNNVNQSDSVQVSNDVIGLSKVTDDMSTNLIQNSHNSVELKSKENNENIYAFSNNKSELKSKNGDILGNTINVSGTTFQDIRDAYRIAQPGDIINLGGKTYNGTYSKFKFDEKTNITFINGILDASKAGSDSESLFLNTTLINITFINYRCSAFSSFGFTYSKLKNVKFNNFTNDIACFVIRYSVLENVTFSNCKSLLDAEPEDERGYEKGAMVISYWSEFNNCNFINTSTKCHSGAICVGGRDTNYIILTNTTFNNCSAGVGGAVYVHGNANASASMHSVIINCTFINNHASEVGGALGSSHNYLHVENCTFINNTAKKGAAFMVGGIDHGLDGNNREGHYNTMKNCYFYNNTGTEEGGAVHIWGDYCTAEDCLFEDNFAVNGNGAAIFVKGLNASVINSEFYKHLCERGTIYIEGANASVINSTLKHNIASLGGAGVYIQGNNSLIYNSTFEDNNATVHGGAVHAHGDYARIINSNFYSNNAIPHPENTNQGLGGAVYILGDFNNIAYCEFMYNTARNGSAIYSRGSNLTIEDDRFIQNQAWSYILGILAIPQISYYSPTNKVSVNITHVGGDNIINAIYNDGISTNIIFYNVTYTHSTNKSGTINTGSQRISPVMGIESSQGGKLLYQDPREDLQNITIVIIREKVSNTLSASKIDGDVVYNQTQLTGLYGNITIDLVGLPVGKYHAYAEHEEDMLYKAIDNETRFEILPLVDLSVNKSSDKDSYFVGDIATYTIFVESLDGNTTDVSVSEIMPDSFEILSYNLTKGTFNSNTKNWFIGDLKTKENATLTLQVKLTKGGKFTNIVNVTCKEKDINLTNNIANKTITVQFTDLQLIKIVNPKKVKVGENVIWTITVKNIGSLKATNITVIDKLPISLKYISHTTSVGEYDPNTGIWSFDELDVGSQVVLTITTRVLLSGKIVNSAGVSCAEDSNDTNNNDSAFVIAVKNDGKDNSTKNKTTNVDIINNSTTDDDPVSDLEDVSLKRHVTGNPLLLVLLSLFTIFIGYRKKSN